MCENIFIVSINILYVMFIQTINVVAWTYFLEQSKALSQSNLALG